MQAYFPVVFAVIAGIGLLAAVWLTMRRRSAGTGAFAALRDRELEALIAAAFRSQGYESVKSPGGPSLANSGEMVLRRERTTFLLESRHVRSAKVGVDAVQALQRAMATRGATAGFLLTGGRFSREAAAFAPGCGIRLVDGPALAAMLKRVKAP